jgi:aryl-alcohol dehydrogenase-like predicted oxidoreductase
VNFFDNAEVYASGKAEEIMGQAIKELGWKRSDLVLSTKVFWGGQGPNDVGLSRKHIIEAAQACLKRLQTDYVDVIFCHRPDSSTPIEETVRAMNFVIDKGWAFYWGTSEWDAQQITEACEVAARLNLIGPSVEQPQYNLLTRDRVCVLPSFPACAYASLDHGCVLFPGGGKSHGVFEAGAALCAFPWVRIHGLCLKLRTLFVCFLGCKSSACV